MTVSIDDSGRPPLPITVGAFNAMVRDAIEGAIAPLWIAGEVSNFTRAASGHCYFSLKDAQAQVRCTLFRNRAQSLKALPANGDQLEVFAVPTFYEARGEFQLNVEMLRRGGLGRLFEEFERLKNKLRAEGLFDATRKRPLPAFPRTVGIVTSSSGAALRDVLATLKRRMPAIAVIVYPTLVQGTGAAAKVAQAIERASRRRECDVLLLCRGGGSIEDLWAFNEEIVARAIVACAVPVVTGVGHETDVTIADFAADQRAPTPTAAAELVSPDRVQWLRRWDDLRRRWTRAAERQMENRFQRLDGLARRLVHPGERLRQRRMALRQLHDRLHRTSWRHLDAARRSMAEALSRWQAARPDLRRQEHRVRQLHEALVVGSSAKRHALTARVARIAGKLEALDPRRVLDRGYAIVRGPRGLVVTQATTLREGDALAIQFAGGQVGARVESVSEDADSNKD